MFTMQAIEMMLTSTPIGYAYHELVFDQNQFLKDIRIIDFNPAYLKILGLEDERIKDQNLFEFFPQLKSEIPGLLDILVRALSFGKGEFYSGFIPSFNKWVNIHFFSPEQNHFIAQLVDVTALIQQEEQIYYLSFHDRLTGLYNRAYFEEELNRLDKDRALPFTLIMGDVNGLKIINDVFGHIKGDQILKAIADILKSSCRKEDIIARWGGDEFIILLPNSQEKGAKEVIDRIKANCELEEPNLPFVNISLGYAVRTSRELDIEELLIQAENNMYRKKIKEGKEIRERIISSMMDFLYEGNYEIKYHIDRIRSYIRLISMELRLAPMDEKRLLLLAKTHDIGKIPLSKKLLDSPHIFSKSEYEEIQVHSEIGYRIAKSLPELADVADLILHHHERWDGRGYPHGLKGEEIPYLVRIFTLVDSFDAVRRERKYRRAFTRQEALEHLTLERGRQFDPEIVDVFLKLIK